MKQYLHIQNHHGKNVYYLNKEGREIIGCRHEAKWNLQAEHHLLRNDVYIFYGCPASWEVERKVYFKVGISQEEKHIIPDARFYKDGNWHFIEIDRTQSMNENEAKIKRYAELTPIMFDESGKRPLVIFYTLTEYRQEKLKRLCADYKVACKIWTKQDLR